MFDERTVGDEKNGLFAPVAGGEKHGEGEGAAVDGFAGGGADGIASGKFDEDFVAEGAAGFAPSRVLHDEGFPRGEVGGGEFGVGGDDEGGEDERGEEFHETKDGELGEG